MFILYEVFMMWSVGDVGCLGYGMFRMWDTRIWNVENVRCLGCRMFRMFTEM